MPAFNISRVNPLPCPQCGSDPERVQSKKGCSYFHACLKDPRFYLEMVGWYDTENNAINAWNEIIENLKRKA